MTMICAHSCRKAGMSKMPKSAGTLAIKAKGHKPPMPSPRREAPSRVAARTPSQIRLGISRDLCEIFSLNALALSFRAIERLFKRDLPHYSERIRATGGFLISLHLKFSAGKSTARRCNPHSTALCEGHGIA
jgi:hypothetical protein